MVSWCWKWISPLHMRFPLEKDHQCFSTTSDNVPVIIWLAGCLGIGASRLACGFTQIILSNCVWKHFVKLTEVVEVSLCEVYNVPEVIYNIDSISYLYNKLWFIFYFISLLDINYDSTFTFLFHDCAWLMIQLILFHFIMYAFAVNNAWTAFVLIL